MRLLPAALVLVVGCAGPWKQLPALPADASAQGYRIVSRPAPLPHGHVQADCGPEALCAVLRYYGRPADVDEVTARLYRRELKGTLSIALAPMAREKGLAAELKYGNLNQLKHAVDSDAPSIIMVEVRQNPKFFHFFVVVGYNDAKLEVVCESYDGGKYLISYETLEASWRAADYFWLELREAKADDDAELGVEYETKRDYKRAMPFLLRALESDPRHVEALLSLGNCLNETGDLKGARDAYERALRESPDHPKVCNNLADLYVRIGGPLDEAERLAAKAVQGLEQWKVRFETELAKAHPAIVKAVKKDIADTTLDLAATLGTLGQARSAAGRHAAAIAAWEASLALIPEGESDWRARRMYAIGQSYEQLRRLEDARRQYRLALEIVQDPALKVKLEQRLQ